MNTKKIKPHVFVKDYKSSGAKLSIKKQCRRALRRMLKNCERLNG